MWWWLQWQKKKANVSASVEPEVKKQAEAILSNLGLPVSVVIETLYRQIIINGSLPYSINNLIFPTLDNLSKKEFDGMMFKGDEEALNGESEDADLVFHKLRKDL